jgi:hypothetical protein
MKCQKCKFYNIVACNGIHCTNEKRCQRDGTGNIDRFEYRETPFEKWDKKNLMFPPGQVHMLASRKAAWEGAIEFAIETLEDISNHWEMYNNWVPIKGTFKQRVKEGVNENNI